MSKARGLMFKNRVEKPLVMIFPKSQVISLHMCFVFCPIDVLFLDDGGRVVDLKPSFRPFTFYRSCQKASYCIELPSGTIQQAGVETGDLIRIRDLL